MDAIFSADCISIVEYGACAYNRRLKKYLHQDNPLANPHQLTADKATTKGSHVRAAALLWSFVYSSFYSIRHQIEYIQGTHGTKFSELRRYDCNEQLCLPLHCPPSQDKRKWNERIQNLLAFAVFIVLYIRFFKHQSKIEWFIRLRISALVVRRIRDLMK